MRTRLFRALLALLPREFRARFSDELLDTAAALDRARPVNLAEAPGVIVDAATTVVAIRREMRLEARPVERRSARNVMNSLQQDVRFAVRGLRRDVWFTMFVVAALTLGIGANAAMFGIVDRLLVSGPPHIQDSSRVVRFYLTSQPDGMRSFTTSSFGHVSYDLAQRNAKSFDGVASYAVNTVVVGSGADAHAAQGGYASETLFPLLGVTPQIGRFFKEDENRPDAAAHVAVLGYAAWQRWFGGRPDAIGRNVTIGSVPYAIVGVAPRGFTGPQFGPVDVWLPINLRGPTVQKGWQTSWNAQWLEIVGRLAPGVTFARASEELTAIHQRAYTGTEPYIARGRMTVAAISANDAGVEAPELTVVRWLSGVALIVLLIACANVANLLLARGLRRSREVALRAALGAGRSRLVRLLLVESLLLACAGAAGGLIVAYGLGGLARTVIFSWVDWTTSPVDARVFAASGVLAIAVGVVVGLLPAWRATRVSLTDALKQGVREGGGQRSRMRHALTIAQAALCVVLLVGAGLFVRSLWNVRTLALGVDPDRVVVVEVSRSPLGRIQDPAALAAERERRAQAAADGLARVRQIPSVEHASLAVGTPFGNRFTVEVAVPGLATVPRLKTGGPSVSAVGADYFATVGTPILRGRAFAPEDHAGTEAVAIVSDTMAKTVWPGEDPIGKCFFVGKGATTCARVVGIAGDTHRSQLREPPVMHYYIPIGQEVGFGGTVLLVRSSGTNPALGPAIKSALVEYDASIRFISLTTIQEAVDPQVKPWRIGATVFSLSGILALLVAAIGIYSVMSYLVADRTHEIGVRLALGARRGDVARLILRGSLGMAAIGVAAGSLIALGASRFVEPLLFDESPRDPVVYGIVAGVLLLVALAAGIIPTLRANRIDPLEALRVE
ncbi:MAG TPA: ABC transporter permease [Vicinamibacterales bacterium]|nr:ABC transporter permease [Vicinamibacterales bacterium]